MLDRNSDVSRLLDRLIDKELVTKTQCESDKRASDVKITASGLKLLTKIDERLDEIDSKILNLTTKEANQLSDLLDKCRG
jgi:DNA-binding MarR family transcriptional regulator